ncbi:MAG: DUF4159 domain-containing protein [Phycisphaeraceae bacterium]
MSITRHHNGRSAQCRTWPIMWLAAAALLVAGSARADEDAEPGLVRSANLIYGQSKSSVCFSDEFLAQVQKETHIRTHHRFFPVKLSETEELFEHPFAVMTGEGGFELTDLQRQNMVDYLHAGGFVIASAGCSSQPWNRSFKREIERMFPDRALETLGADHPIFHTVYDIRESKYKSSAPQLPELRGLSIDGRTVLVWSPDGLNDTANAGSGCCCCGGNEIKQARALNVNILVYALTH